MTPIVLDFEEFSTKGYINGPIVSLCLHNLVSCPHENA
jgi:hypothetical protein